MPSTKDIVLGRKIMLLLVARNGSGKTVQTATFAGSGPGKIFDFDGRMDSIKKVFPEADIEFDTIGVKDVLDEEGRYRVKGFSKFTKEFIDLSKSCPYKWISIDSITSLTTTVVNYQMIQKGGETKETKGGIQIPSWDEFNGEAMLVSRLLDIAKMLPCHVIFTAHPVMKTDINNSKVVESLVSFGVKVPNLIPGYFNEIFYMDLEANIDATKPPSRVLYTHPTMIYPAKTTLPLPRKITLPDNSSTGLYQIIQAAINNPSAPNIEK